MTEPTVETQAEPTSPNPTAPATDRHSPSTLQLFQGILKCEQEGGTLYIIKNDQNEHCMQVTSKLQPSVQVYTVDFDTWNDYSAWKQSLYQEMARCNEEEIESRRQRLEDAIVAMQRSCPGRWDHKFWNDKGEPYIESVVGLNPLAHGYSCCTSDPPEISSAEVEPTLTTQAGASADPEDVTELDRSFTVDDANLLS